MKILNLFIIFLLLISCINKTPNDSIETTIQPDEFQIIIKKVLLMNAHIQNNKKYSMIDKDSISHITLKILEEGDFNKNDLLKAIKFYSSNPNLLDSLIIDLKDSLNENQVDISHDYLENYNKMPNDSLKKILMTYPYIKTDNLKKGFTFTYNEKDSIIMFFKKNRKMLNNYSFKVFIDKFNSSINLK
tara:strand:+ start:536 stop:1099 length:564 start_codon:yes stop_codon:yes gene_type:complete